MPYGQGGRLGDTIDPRLMMADYGGFANAGMIKGQMFQNAGEQIGDALKMRGEQEKFIKKNEKLAKDIGELIPELKGQATDALNALTNPDLSHRDRLAMAESISETLKIGMLGIENQRAKDEMALRRAALAASRSGREQTPFDPVTGIELLRASGANAQADALEKSLAGVQSQAQYDAVAGTIRSLVGDVKPIIPQPEEPVSGQLVWKDNKAYSFNPKTNQMAPVVEARPKRTGMAGVVDTITDTLFGQKPVTRQPDAPAAQETLDVKMNAAKSIANLYASGDRAKALQLFTAAGFNGAFGGTPTMQDLDDWAASQGVTQSQPVAPSGIFSTK